jgi:hypothetical protein
MIISYFYKKKAAQGFIYAIVPGNDCVSPAQYDVPLDHFNKLFRFLFVHDSPPSFLQIACPGYRTQASRPIA